MLEFNVPLKALSLNFSQTAVEEPQLSRIQLA